MSEIVELVIDKKKSQFPFKMVLKCCEPRRSLKTTLENKISSVLQKISESDRSILWVIYPCLSLPLCKNNYKLKNSLCDYIDVIISKEDSYSLCKKEFTDTGFSYPQDKNIFISEVAIQNPFIPYSSQGLDNKYPFSLSKPKSNDTLANIIMDELAHIKSQKNHGNPEYDGLLKNYMVKYYGL